MAKIEYDIEELIKLAQTPPTKLESLLLDVPNGKDNEALKLICDFEIKEGGNHIPLLAVYELYLTTVADGETPITKNKLSGQLHKHFKRYSGKQGVFFKLDAKPFANINVDKKTEKKS